MLAAHETISEFLKTNVNSELSSIDGITVKYSLRAAVQPNELPNCLNVRFHDDANAGSDPMFPHWRMVGVSLNLTLQMDVNNPLLTEATALRVIEKIDKFMRVQSTPKYDYSSGTAVWAGSHITWRDSYPLEWLAPSTEDDRYILRSAFVFFRYFANKN